MALLEARIQAGRAMQRDPFGKYAEVTDFGGAQS